MASKAGADVPAGRGAGEELAGEVKGAGGRVDDAANGMEAAAAVAVGGSSPTPSPGAVEARGAETEEGALGETPDVDTAGEALAVDGTFGFPID